MRFNAKYLTPLALAGTAALAAAPTATASPPTCTYSGAATQCETPGNSQITASAPSVQQQPEVIIIHRNHR
jgi:hypothetical protein